MGRNGRIKLRKCVLQDDHKATSESDARGNTICKAHWQRDFCGNAWIQVSLKVSWLSRGGSTTEVPILSRSLHQRCLQFPHGRRGKRTLIIPSRVRPAQEKEIQTFLRAPCCDGGGLTESQQEASKEEVV